MSKLTKAQWRALAMLGDAAMPKEEFSVAVRNALLGRKLASSEVGPSPYAVNTGRPILFLVITPSGREALSSVEGKDDALNA